MSPAFQANVETGINRFVSEVAKEWKTKGVHVRFNYLPYRTWEAKMVIRPAAMKIAFADGWDGRMPVGCTARKVVHNTNTFQDFSQANLSSKDALMEQVELSTQGWFIEDIDSMMAMLKKAKEEREGELVA